MRKEVLIISLLCLGLVAAIAVPARAADVVVTITVPDAYVQRLADMIEARHMPPINWACAGLTVKECFIKMYIVENVKRELRSWEQEQARDAAAASVSNIVVTGE